MKIKYRPVANDHQGKAIAKAGNWEIEAMIFFKAATEKNGEEQPR